MFTRYLKIALLSIAALGFSAGAMAQKSIVVSSTTSTEQSGLFNFLLPIYTAVPTFLS